MIRTTEITIDQNTWSRGIVPTEIAALAGTWKPSVLQALLHTAICTRPPVVHGFHLSDFWAWLRYHFAISTSPDLRLRKEWDTIDAHQKTVLSDDFGIGFTTLLLARRIGCRDFADTLYFIKVLDPGKFDLLSSVKRGPRKSPDYICRDSSSNYWVIECKGTQTSRKALTISMQRGMVQKRNLKARQGSRIKHSLVAGLFIPQAFSSEFSCIRLADPSWAEVDKILHEQPPERVDEALSQVSLAKCLALAGFSQTATILGSAPVRAIRRLSEGAREELRRGRQESKRPLEVLYDTGDIVLRANEDEIQIHRARFLAKAPDHVLELIQESERLDERIRHLSEVSLTGGWDHRLAEHYAEIQTPLGFRYRLEVQ